MSYGVLGKKEKDKDEEGFLVSAEGRQRAQVSGIFYTSWRLQ